MTTDAEPVLASGEAEAAEVEHPLSPDVYNAFVNEISLSAINLVKISGERRSEESAPTTNFELSAGYQLSGDHLSYRFDVVGHLTNEENADLGELAASVVVVVTTPSAPSRACIERFGGTSAAMMAHPYLREALASTALRLGFPGVLLPVLVAQPEPRQSTEESSRGDEDP